MKEFASHFKRPTKFGGYLQELSIGINKTQAGIPIYWTRRYLDINKQVLWKVSDVIPEALYGEGVIRLPINDAFPVKSKFIEAVVTDTDETIPFPPDDVPVPPVADNFEFNFDFSEDFNA